MDAITSLMKIKNKTINFKVISSKIIHQGYKKLLHKQRDSIPNQRVKFQSSTTII
jgi:hypothetical protein